ncbi:NAD(P)/FAD-dependent oxidoreductase [Amaricoccus solimangrovi]|uniref:Thioredoxin reductase n=1 Tax=Amaricoccus solimangrovi TaxID=2589815 RepID=A0A501WGZ1_9RHOB|nr:FAD-dependent oxidoreductase [Amaricoccus solimangrovi]TPE47324.1 hypothetical protein FJM51_20310 [Amaricoccus solimangrovi]
MHDFDLIVIGQGYAGLRAARAARDRGLTVATCEAVMAGGAVATVLRLDPSPVPFTGSGPDLGAIVAMENMDGGIVPYFEAATHLSPEPRGGWRMSLPSGSHHARHVILATGTRPRALGVPGEAEFAGSGVSRCADCDGPRVRDRDALVVGGGDAAFQEAAILARFARSVTIVLRGARPRARAALVEPVLAATNVHLLRESRLGAIHGTSEEGVTGATLLTPSGPATRACAGVFILAGGAADTRLVPPSLPRGADGGLVAEEGGRLGLPGLWAAGSVRSGFRGGLREAGEDGARVAAALG